MSGKKTQNNRNSSNAGKGGKASKRGNHKQGRGKPASRGDLTTGKGTGYNHVSPIGNRKSKRHKTHRVSADKASGKQQTKPKMMPKGQIPRNSKAPMVPWVELPKSAQVHHYYFVIREMLEGAYEWDTKDKAHGLGIRQLDLHGSTAGSVESILTRSPRLSRDWRAVVGILRMLHADDLIPSSFVEKTLNNHPLMGARSVRVSQDTNLISDYIADKTTVSNKSWVKDAKASYARALKRIRADWEKETILAEQAKYPDLSTEQYAHAASVAWESMSDDRKAPTVEVKGVAHLCTTEEQFVTHHMQRRARKEAARLPALYRLKGGVSYKMMDKDGEIVSRGDFVNIEYAVSSNGKIFLAVVNGGGKGKVANSPFRSEYCKMKSRKGEPLHVDDIGTPPEVVSDVIQRESLPSEEAKLPSDTTRLKEVLGNKKKMMEIIEPDMHLPIEDVVDGMNQAQWGIPSHSKEKVKKGSKKQTMRKVDISASRRAGKRLAKDEDE
ncbi:MAG: hypothetical protein CMA05_04715 [Euryarchaeota archaeon]|nr:hypothetical protein [Euryarchaeota archaeon]